MSESEKAKTNKVILNEIKEDFEVIKEDIQVIKNDLEEIKLILENKNTSEEQTETFWTFLGNK